MSRHLSHLMLAAAALLLVGGCQTSPYDNRYVYSPRPLTLETTPPGMPEAGAVRTLVSVVGVRQRDEDADLPASVHLRIRLDNTTESTVTFDPGTLSLFAADVREFPPPILQPAETVTLGPNGTATVNAFFPLPGERVPAGMDLSGLSARWAIEVDGRTVPDSATFARRDREYYRNEPRFNVGFGAGYHRHYWY